MNPHNNHSDKFYQRTLWISTLIVAFLIALYTLTYNGLFRVDDEHILGARAQSLALWGRLEEPQVFGNQRVQELEVLGDQATQIEPLHSILGAGFYRIGLLLGTGGAQAYFLQNIYLTALCAGIIFLTARSLNASEKASLLSALLFGTGSMAWPYAMAYYRDSLAMLFCSLVLLGFALRARSSGKPAHWGYLLMVVGFFGGILSKNSSFVIFPAIVLGLMVESIGSDQNTHNLFLYLLGITLSIAAVLLLVSWLPPEGFLARFSLEYYQFVFKHFVESFDSGTLIAFLGPFFSPSKSIFLFSPPLLALMLLLQKSKMEWNPFIWVSIGFTLFLAFGQALFYGDGWAGTFGWGLRYMLPALPGLFVSIAFSLEEVIHRETARWLFLALAILSVLIQVSGVFIPWVQPYVDWQQQGLQPYGEQASWQVRYLAIPYHISYLLKAQPLQIAWFRAQMAAAAAWLIPALTILLISVFAWLLYGVWKHNRIKIQNWAYSLLLIAVVIFPIFPNLNLLKSDYYWGGDKSSYLQVLNYVSISSKSDDSVIIDAYGTRLWNVWMNRWDRPIPWYALPYENPSSLQSSEEGINLPSPTLNLMETISRSKSRCWYVASSSAPDYLFSGEVAWLESRFKFKD
jgi:hypothetical protein